MSSLDIVLFALAPFSITSYELELTSVEKGSNVTLLCEVTVDEDYDMDLVTVYYRYYVSHEVAEFVRYNAELDIDSKNKTITAELNIRLVDIQHRGEYECYIRSLPADHYIDADDDYYEVARNTTLNENEAMGMFVCLSVCQELVHYKCCYCSEIKSTDSLTGSNHVTVIVVTVLSVMSAITALCIILLLIYIIHKKAVMYRNKDRLPSLMDNESLFPVLLDIPNEPKSSRQPSLVRIM